MAEPRIALVTGAAKRIGAEIAWRLASEGYSVAVHFGDSGSSARDLVKQLNEEGAAAAAFGCDLANESELRDLIPRVEDEFGNPVTMLINNASIYKRDDATTTTAESWQGHMSVNLYAPFVLTQVLSARLPADWSAHVVNVIDQRVCNPSRDFLSYTVSKSALWTLTQILAKELAPAVRVNAVGPGPTLQSVYQTSDEFDQEQRSVPLGRGPEPKEIADAILFLDRSPSVTGILLPIDGGQHLVGQAQLVGQETDDDRS